MGRQKQISNETWMDTFNRIHNPWMFNNEKKTKKVKIKGTRKKKNTFEIDKAIVDKIQNNYLIEDSD